MYDGEKVVGKLFFGRSNVVVLDQEFRVVLRTQPLKEAKGDSAESVSVGYHKLFDRSLQYELNHFTERFSLEVDAGADVREDFVFWVPFLHEVFLAKQILFLLRRADSAVGNLSPFLIKSSSKNLVDFVSSMSAWSLDNLDLSFLFPRQEGGS